MSFTFPSTSLILFLFLCGLIKLSCVRLYPLEAFSSLQCNNYHNGCILYTVHTDTHPRKITHTHTNTHHPGEAEGRVLMSLIINKQNQSMFTFLVSVLLSKGVNLVYVSIFAHVLLYLWVSAKLHYTPVWGMNSICSQCTSPEELSAVCIKAVSQWY